MKERACKHASEGGARGGFVSEVKGTMTTRKTEKPFLTPFCFTQIGAGQELEGKKESKEKEAKRKMPRILALHERQN